MASAITRILVLPCTVSMGIPAWNFALSMSKSGLQVYLLGIGSRSYSDPNKERIDRFNKDVKKGNLDYLFRGHTHSCGTGKEYMSRFSGGDFRILSERGEPHLLVTPEKTLLYFIENGITYVREIKKVEEPQRPEGGLEAKIKEVLNKSGIDQEELDVIQPDSNIEVRYRRYLN